MNLLGKTYFRYITIGATYGAVRKINYLSNEDLHIQKYDYHDKYAKVPLLMTQKISVLIGGTALCAFYWPWYMMEDISRIELYVLKKNPQDYGYDEPTSLIGHIFN